MTLLLDTHTILWMTEQVTKLGRVARRSCDDALAARELAIPVIAFYEAGRLLKRGRVEGPPTVREWRQRLLSFGVKEVAMSSEVAVLASELDDLHGDPIDRVIVATAIVEGAVLLTADRPILDWPGSMRRQDARR
ncbi:type II toxin-antitoxin system VapC family toxin [Reyranella sp.]|uniref:type II toxin-antitoxin system VapC family toxin n=1 Tax=Reyranella sp. TaxID=1929291 RepID=UPI003784629B